MGFGLVMKVGEEIRRRDFFDPSAGVKVGEPKSDKQGPRRPTQWISYQPQTDSWKQEEANERKGDKDSGICTPAALWPFICGCEGEENCSRSGGMT